MAVILAAIVITVFASIFIPPLVYPSHEQFVASSSTFSPYGFSLLLTENATRIVSGQDIDVTAVMNNTSYEVLQVPAASDWPLAGLYTRPCFTGWPMGIGIMQGYYTSDNFTSGTLLKLQYPQAGCSSGTSSAPTIFLIEADSPDSVANSTNSVQTWNLTFSLDSRSYAGANGTAYFQGVYTVVVADEWGDTAITHFAAQA